MDPKEISDRDLINEGIAKNPYPFWLWLGVLVILLALAWGINSWYFTTISQRIYQNPFLQVTNRDLSLFLWNNPHHMRAHSSKKGGYLPAFQYLNKVTVEPELADQYAVAPPELFFLYHTWNRLVRNEIPMRSISKEEFSEFLNYAEEWQPTFWPAAPEDYISFVSNLYQEKASDLQSLPENTLPKVVRIAFQGWKNYFKEGDLINAKKFSFQEVLNFLKKYPHYSRNYWRNIEGKNYLKSLFFKNKKGDDIMPDEEIAPFLKVALYNNASSKNGPNGLTGLNGR